jgi:hypothetical protein
MPRWRIDRLIRPRLASVDFLMVGFVHDVARSPVLGARAGTRFRIPKIAVDLLERSRSTQSQRTP